MHLYKSSLSLSLLPTPFHRLERLSEHLGVDIWCKRDDLTGFGAGGNKTRKLDYLFADALDRKATDVIAVGGVQSNFCRMACAYAARLKMRCHLVLGGQQAAQTSTGNVLLDQLFGASIYRVSSDDWFEWERQSQELEDELNNAGAETYRLLIGGSTPLGALGYVNAMQELLDDARNASIAISRIVHASSSGGTQAGLLVGAARESWKGRIHGIGVAKSMGELADDIQRLAMETAKLAGVEFGDASVHVDTRWIGPAYATPSPEGKEAQQLFARLEGIVLDDVYTSKAAAGLIGMCRMNEIGSRESVVFLHTGGSPQLFA